MKNIQPKKTKIVATIGPASRNKKVLVDMIAAGLNVVRMNFSHGSHQDHADTLQLVRSAEKTAQQPVAILQDLSGPKIRLGEIKEGSVLHEGSSFVLTTKKCVGNQERAFINYRKLPNEISVGHTVKIDDGKKELQVTSIQDKDITCRVIVGGPISSNKGVNLPDTELSISSLTAKDKKDVLFGIENHVDYIALSFVQTAKDIEDLRKILRRHKNTAKIIAKIETTPAIKNIDEILAVADGAMVARGDMAVEVSIQNVPLVQKMIIQKCNKLGKPVITATQMLDSMEHSPVPTRAEVSDVANAILDGTDAIMLSGESAIGKFPVKSIAMMATIAETTEPTNKNVDLTYSPEASKHVADSIAASAVRIANEVRARLIICLTESGATAQRTARFRPHHGIIAITPNKQVFNQLQLIYGCRPVIAKISSNTNKLTQDIQKIVKKNNWAKSQEKIVVTTGTPFGDIGSTNTVFVIEAL